MNKIIDKIESAAYKMFQVGGTTGLGTGPVLDQNGNAATLLTNMNPLDFINRRVRIFFVGGITAFGGASITTDLQLFAHSIFSTGAITSSGTIILSLVCEFLPDLTNPAGYLLSIQGIVTNLDGTIVPVNSLVIGPNVTSGEGFTINIQSSVLGSSCTPSEFFVEELQ